MKEKKVMNRLGTAGPMVAALAVIALGATLLITTVAPVYAVELNTIEEIYANKAELKGKTVRVHGKVVKVSTAIMGRNWIHIEDGTGSGDKVKIVFRSKTETATVGTEVTATGRLDVDVDFGMGYFYPVIVEDTTFTK